MQNIRIPINSKNLASLDNLIKETALKKGTVGSQLVEFEFPDENTANIIHCNCCFLSEVFKIPNFSNKAGNIVSLNIGNTLKVRGKTDPKYKMAKRSNYSTMNLQMIDLLVPKNGVYFTKLYIDRVEYIATTCILEEDLMRISIDKFQGDIINWDLAVVEFFGFHREKKDFTNDHYLVEQIDKDMIAAKEYFSKLNNKPNRKVR